MKIKKLAAIDIGSNGVRLLVNTIYYNEEKTQFNKTALVRLPIRLGADSFTNGFISKENQKMMIKGMQAFKLLMKVYEVEDYLAFATSAMRVAENGKELVKKIKKESGLKLDIISGKKEAKVIFKTELKEFIANDKNYLFVDVGGGSTELTILANQKILQSKSFPVGTVRILKNTVPDNVFPKEMKEWIQNHCKDMNLEIIGSGGNINFIFKRSGLPLNSLMETEYVLKQYEIFKNTTYEQRLMDFNMKPDRADVVLPALEIYTNVSKWSNSKGIHVPKIGLADGMIQYLFHTKHA